jgi:NADH/F420H2 dehydrogenase subunit C
MKRLNIFKSLPLTYYIKKKKPEFYAANCLLKDLVSTLRFLRDSSFTQYKILTCISAVDYPERNNRFELVYELLSIFNSRFRLKIYTNELTNISSITMLYPCANWWEREVWDIFGVFFESHPDLRRILTDYGFHGHPLRKDFPCNGYTDFYYNQNCKRVVIGKLDIDQIFRVFDYRF